MSRRMLPLLGVGFLGCAVALQLQTRPLGRSSSTVRRSRPRVPPLHSAALQYNDLANADVEAREHLWGAAERRQQRWLARAPCVLALAAACRAARFDAAVASCWAWIHAQPAAHHFMFEACSASFGFLASIVLWSCAHRLLWPRAARAKNLRRFRLDGGAPVAPFEWAGELGLRRMMGAWLPLVAYLASVFAFHSFAVTKPPPPIAPPTFSRFCGELGCGLVLYDMLFAVVHKSLHSKRSPSWWRKVHRTHHEARPSERRGHSLAPLETVQHSFTDGFLQVAANVAVQRLALWPVLSVGGAGGVALAFAPKHPLSKLAHNLVVTYLLVEAHSGYDLPWMTHRLWPTVFGGARAHDAHHVQGAPHYHQFFKL